MLKGAHLTEKKSLEILRFFAEDLTATHIATLTGVSRITVNNYFKTIRLRIARHSEEKNPALNNFKKLSIVYQEEKNHNNEKSRVYPDNSLYGFHWYNGKVFAGVLEKNNTGIEGFEQYKLLNFHAVADFRLWKIFSIQQSETASDDIFCFWNDTRIRIQKFHGLHKRMLYLHVKECEFRYNYRHEDLNSVLKDIMKKHLSIS